MITLRDANMLRTSLKVKFSNYSWYVGSMIIPNTGGYTIIVNVKDLNNRVRKVVPPVIDGVDIKVEVV